MPFTTVSAHRLINWRVTTKSRGARMIGLIPSAPARAVAANRLTGAYRLDQARSDNPATVADRGARGLPGGEQQRRRNIDYAHYEILGGNL